MASFGFLLLALHPIRWRTAHACWSNACRKSYEKITRYSLSSSDSCQVICWLRKEHRQLLLPCSRNPCAVTPLPPQLPQQNAKFWISVGSKHLILHLPCLFEYFATLNFALHCIKWLCLYVYRKASNRVLLISILKGHQKRDATLTHFCHEPSAFGVLLSWWCSQSNDCSFVYVTRLGVTFQEFCVFIWSWSRSFCWSWGWCNARGNRCCKSHSFGNSINIGHLTCMHLNASV